MSESETYVQLPVIDLSQPLDASSLSSLSEACLEWGFFLINNHGISDDVFHKISILSKQLFNLPSETKLKIGPSSSIKTYKPQLKDTPFFEALTVHGPDFLTSIKTSADFLFDKPNSEFCEIVAEYGAKMTELSQRVTKIVLMALGEGIEKKYNESEFSNCNGYLRLVNYTPPESVEEKEVELLKNHVDAGVITIVYQGEIGGLQIKSREGKWYDIKPSNETLVVNIGDLLEAWSNGRLSSTEHRVVLKKFENRFSISFFWMFEKEKLVLAPEEVVGEGKPRMYKPFECMDYFIFRSKHPYVNVKDFARIRCEVEG